MNKSQKQLLQKIEDVSLRKKVVKEIYTSPKELRITEDDLFELFTLKYEHDINFRKKINRWLKKTLK
jgi:hypothetical protein